MCITTIDPGGPLRSVRPHYLCANHGVATSICQINIQCAQDNSNLKGNFLNCQMIRSSIENIQKGYLGWFKISRKMSYPCSS